MEATAISATLLPILFSLPRIVSPSTLVRGPSMASSQARAVPASGTGLAGYRTGKPVLPRGQHGRRVGQSESGFSGFRARAVPTYSCAGRPGRARTARARLVTARHLRGAESARRSRGTLRRRPRIVFLDRTVDPPQRLPAVRALESHLQVAQLR